MFVKLRLECIIVRKLLCEFLELFRLSDIPSLVPILFNLCLGLGNVLQQFCVCAGLVGAEVVNFVLYAVGKFLPVAVYGISHLL